MKVTGIAFTAYPGKDVQKLLEFYRDALGLRVDRAHPDEKQARFVEFDLGNNQWFTLVPESFLERPAGSGGGVVFDAALERVRPHATKADEKPADYPNCRMAEFDDPEGNRVGLHQTKASAA